MPIAASSSAQRAEDRHQPHVEPLARRRARDDLVHRPHVGHRQAASPGAAAPGSARSATAASTCVRTTHAIGVRRTFSALAASGTCACGMNICGRGSLSSPPSRMSPTTPMICRSGSSANSRMTPRPIDEPIVQRIALRPELLRHRLVDDRRPAATCCVSRSVNVAAALHRNLEHLEVARRDRHPAAAAVERPAVGGAAGRRCGTAGRSRPRAARSTWRSRATTPGIARSCSTPSRTTCSTRFRLLEPRARQRHPHRQHVVRVEAGIDARRAPPPCG